MRELTAQEAESQEGNGLGKLDYQRQLSKRIGELWRNEDADIKATFYEKSKQAAREHAERYPEYRFKPAKKSALQDADDCASPSTKLAKDKTPERKVDTDFAPGSLSGPISGSGSGSGRKRASLEGARNNVSPYSVGRHRRTSSNGPASPPMRQNSRHQVQPPAPLLLYAASDMVTTPAHSLPLARSLSQHYTDRHQSNKVRASARRSLDGHILHASSQNNSFNTLLPQHLREQSRVFLAPIEPPPVPVGLAITTDQEAVASETTGTQRQQSPRPPISLAEAVKRALPPDRRALLHASLAKKGFVTSDEPISPLTQPHRGTPMERTASAPSPARFQESQEAFTSSNGQVNLQRMCHSQEFATSSSRPTDSPQRPSVDLLPALDPANQAPLPDSNSQSHSGPSVNVKMNDHEAEKYGCLADWNQPPPSWLDYSLSQTSSQQSFAASTGNFTYSGERIIGGTIQLDTAPQYSGPRDPFAAIEMGQYGVIDPHIMGVGSGIDAMNSAVIALSDPNDAGQVQGQFYSLDGEQIGQGLVDGNQQGGNRGNFDEELRQYQAVQELLSQMMEASTQQTQQTSRFQFESHLPTCPSHSLPAYNDTSQSQQPQQHQSPYSQDPSQWQSWPASSSHSQVLGAYSNQSDSKPIAFEAGLQGEQTMYDDAQRGPQTTFSNLVGLSRSQEWSSMPQEAPLYSRIASPTLAQADLNFSRPIQQVSYSHPSNSQPGNAIHEHQKNIPEQSTLDAAGILVQSGSRARAEGGQSAAKGKGLRNRKNSHFSSIKEKFARIKHRSSQSSGSKALDAPDLHASQS